MKCRKLLNELLYHQLKAKEKKNSKKKIKQFFVLLLLFFCILQLERNYFYKNDQKVCRLKYT